MSKKKKPTARAKTPAKKAGPKKAAAKKSAAKNGAAKGPSAKKPAAPKPAAKKPAAKKPAAKKPAAKKPAIAKKPAAKSPAPKKVAPKKAPAAAVVATATPPAVERAVQAVAQATAPEAVATPGNEVDASLQAAKHPRQDELQQIRRLILEASPTIQEGVKWNAPSFRTTDWFATMHLRDPQKLQIVFHLGAKKSEGSQRLPVGGPQGMIEWLANDRCMVTIDDLKRRGKALQAFVRSWILHV